MSVTDKLSVVPGDEIAVTNSLYGRAAILSTDLVFSWCPCELGGTAYSIEMINDERESIHLLLRTDISGLPAVDFDWRSYCGPLRAAAWAASYQDVINVLCAAVGAELVVATIQRSPDLSTEPAAVSHGHIHIGFAVSRHDGLPVCRGILECPPAFAQRILAAQRQPFIQSDWRAVSAAIRCIVDEFSMGPVERDQVEVGCVIMLDNQSLSGRKPRVLLGAGDYRFGADVDGSALRVSSSSLGQSEGVR